MNQRLLRSIVEHIFASLGVIRSDFVDLSKSHSLMEKKWRLDCNISFEEAPELSYPTGQIWGCQISTSEQEVKILLGNCSQEEDFREYALLVQLKNNPCYGLYFIDGAVDPEAMIACSVNGKEWMECNTFLQASFLSGMEQIKEVGLSWSKCSSFEEEVEKLVAFIDYHHVIYEALDERQENQSRIPK